MSVWSYPETPQKVEALFDLLKEPLLAEDAPIEVRNLVGSEELFEEIMGFMGEDPKRDVRILIAHEAALFAAAAVDPEYFETEWGKWIAEWPAGQARQVLDHCVKYVQDSGGELSGPLADWIEANNTMKMGR